GRGDYASRIKQNNVNNGHKQYVPVKNGEKVIRVDESMVANEVKKNDDSDKNKQKEGIEKASDNVESSYSKLKKHNRNINTKNRFEVLGEENESNVSDIWKEVKIHVDVACDMGIPVSEDVISSWSADMVKFYDEEWTKRVKWNVTLEEMLKTKISDLYADIVHLNRNLHVNAKTNALRMIKDFEEATGEKDNDSYEKFFYQTYKEEVIKIGHGPGQYALKLVQFVFGSDAFGSSAQYVDGADDSVQCRYVSGIKISGYGMYSVRYETSMSYVGSGCRNGIFSEFRNLVYSLSLVKGPGSSLYDIDGTSVKY
ncbi:hypothetical protein Tco_1481572, partial [Tanacetum coccineum]